METVCRACGYQRKPTDGAPDWECPSCGKAYAKTADESLGPLVVHANNEGPGVNGSPNTSILSKGSLFIKIVIGLAIFLVASIYQIAEISQLAPGTENFRQTSDLSGAYSFKSGGRQGTTLVDGKVIYCGADYSGGFASCGIHINLPAGSKITVATATIKSNSGTLLYATNVKFNSQEIYRRSPEESVRKWWIESYISAAVIPLLLMGLYVFISAFLTKAGGDAA